MQNNVEKILNYNGSRIRGYRNTKQVERLIKSGKINKQLAYLEATGCVSTLAAATQGVLQFALVNVAAYFSRRVHFVSIIANAPVCPHKILASPVNTNVGVLSALIDIYNKIHILRVIRKLYLSY